MLYLSIYIYILSDIASQMICIDGDQWKSTLFNDYKSSINHLYNVTCTIDSFYNLLIRTHQLWDNFEKFSRRYANNDRDCRQLWHKLFNETPFESSNAGNGNNRWNVFRCIRLIENRNEYEYSFTFIIY
jgi:hypothetical protein